MCIRDSVRAVRGGQQAECGQCGDQVAAADRVGVGGVVDAGRGGPPVQGERGDQPGQVAAVHHRDPGLAARPADRHPADHLGQGGHHPAVARPGDQPGAQHARAGLQGVPLADQPGAAGLGQRGGLHLVHVDARVRALPVHGRRREVDDPGHPGAGGGGHQRGRAPVVHRLALRGGAVDPGGQVDQHPGALAEGRQRRRVGEVARHPGGAGVGVLGHLAGQCAHPYAARSERRQYPGADEAGGSGQCHRGSRRGSLFRCHVLALPADQPTSLASGHRPARRGGGARPGPAGGQAGVRQGGEQDGTPVRRGWGHGPR